MIDTDIIEQVNASRQFFQPGGGKKKVWRAENLRGQESCEQAHNPRPVYPANYRGTHRLVPQVHHYLQTGPQRSILL